MFVVEVSMGHGLTKDRMREIIEEAPFFIDPDNTDVMYGVARGKASTAKKYVVIIFSDDDITALDPMTIDEVVAYVNSQGLLLVNARLSLD